MRLHLVGPRQGQTVRLGGFQFVKGSVNIPDDAGYVQNMLANFHNAYPEGRIQRDGEGKLSLRRNGPGSSWRFSSCLGIFRRHLG